ncbi:MAG TPA: DUF167 domain-containing protein [Dehalococcoidia bacterium]|nr:DUF167 domain-containing protein [Dehalococcoidia bacterium]
MPAHLTVRVTPNAARDEVKSVSIDRIEIRLRAPALEGRANRALIAFLADRLAVRPRAVTIERGQTGRIKLVASEGLDHAAALERLLAPP